MKLFSAVPPHLPVTWNLNDFYRINDSKKSGLKKYKPQVIMVGVWYTNLGRMDNKVL